jgi:Na+/H+ antiporter NhaC
MTYIYIILILIVIFFFLSIYYKKKENFQTVSQIQEDNKAKILIRNSFGKTKEYSIDRQILRDLLEDNKDLNIIS